MTWEWRMFRASANMLRGAQWREKTQWTAENRGESETSDGMSDVSDVLSLLWPLSPLLYMRSPAASVPSWLVITGAPLSSQHRDDCKTILVGGVQTLRKTQAHSSHSQTRFSIFCIMMLHWDAITSHHKRCLRLTRHLESFRVSLFSIDCHFLSYDRHWQEVCLGLVFDSPCTDHQSNIHFIQFPPNVVLSVCIFYSGTVPGQDRWGGVNLTLSSPSRMGRDCAGEGGYVQKAKLKSSQVLITNDSMNHKRSSSRCLMS